ncbi:MAG: hypothetical protein H7832_09055 [Magnetococcus sp. DMHC-6]
MTTLAPLERLEAGRFDTPTILKKLASSSRQLAELKGVAASIPNQAILINTLGLQEAKDSSEIENIVTTHDELFKFETSPDASNNPAAKEVLRYRQALRLGYEYIQRTGLLTTNHMIEIQAELEEHDALRAKKNQRPNPGGMNPPDPLFFLRIKKKGWGELGGGSPPPQGLDFYFSDT